MKSFTKKIIALTLALLMAVSVVAVGAFAAEENSGVTLISAEDWGKMKGFVPVEGSDDVLTDEKTFSDYKDLIVKIIFVDSVAYEGGAGSVAWLIDEGANDAIAYIEINLEETVGTNRKYNLYIGSEGTLCANPNSNDLFADMTNLKEIVNLKKLNTSRVTKMNNMFGGCVSLEGIDLSGFNTEKVVDMGFMFNNCRSLTELDLSGFKTSNVVHMNYMFNDCRNLTELDLSSFGTEKVCDMQNMFSYCEKLRTIYVKPYIKGIYDTDYWTTYSVTEGKNMFFNCLALKGNMPYNAEKVSAAYANSDYYLTPIDPPVDIVRRVEVQKGDSLELSRVIPFNQTEKIKEYKSLNELIVSVDSETGRATGNALGSAIIETTLKEGTEGSITFVVTVIDNQVPPVTPPAKDPEPSGLTKTLMDIFAKIEKFFNDLIEKFLGFFIPDVGPVNPK